MANYLIVGRRFIPREHIAFVEPFAPDANPRFKTSRDFQSRVVLVNRDSILVEETPQAFADANGFRLLPMDRVATNPAIHYRVEMFLPVDGFTPAKPFASRLLWRDLDGNEQSKLLLSEPETVLTIAVQGIADKALPPKPATPPRHAKRQRAASKAQASQP